MAKKKKKIEELLMNSAFAFGGGIASEIVSDLIAENLPDQVAKYPKITELAPAAAGLALLYFMPGKADPAAYGMIGASGAGMADDITSMFGGDDTEGMDGFNRLNLQGSMDMNTRRQNYVQDLINKGFGPNADYGNGMS